MFLEEEIIPDKRPFLAVHAPGREFVYKYFDREFNRRITSSPDECDTDMPAFEIIDTAHETCAESKRFREECARKGLRIITLVAPDIIGTGMNGTMMRFARGVSRGTMLKIKDNTARRSVIHATDVASAAMTISRSPIEKSQYTVSAPPVGVNELLDALGQRIKNKRVGTISAKWGRFIYGKSLYNLLTTDHTVDVSSFEADFPDFRFNNPAEYLTTHIYDDESL